MKKGVSKLAYDTLSDDPITSIGKFRLHGVNHVFSISFAQIFEQEVKLDGIGDGTQISRALEVGKWAGEQVCRWASVEVCTCGSVQVCGKGKNT